MTPSLSWAYINMPSASCFAEVKVFFRIVFSSSPFSLVFPQPTMVKARAIVVIVCVFMDFLANHTRFGICCLGTLDRIVQLQPGESLKVPIVGVKGRAVLDGKGGEVNVGDKIVANASLNEQGRKDIKML